MNNQFDEQRFRRLQQENKQLQEKLNRAKQARDDAIAAMADLDKQNQNLWTAVLKAADELDRLHKENTRLVRELEVSHVIGGALMDRAVALTRLLNKNSVCSPKTTDGVPVVPGMTLWYRSPAGIVETPVLDSWSEIENTMAEDEYYGPIAFYSNKQAAEAAREEKQ